MYSSFIFIAITKIDFFLTSNWKIELFPFFSVLSSDYPQCLTCLMRYPPVPDIGYLIEKAQYLREPNVGVSWSRQFTGIHYVNALKISKKCNGFYEVKTIF